MARHYRLNLNGSICKFLNRVNRIWFNDEKFRSFLWEGGKYCWFNSTMIENLINVGSIIICFDSGNWSASFYFKKNVFQLCPSFFIFQNLMCGIVHIGTVVSSDQYETWADPYLLAFFVCLFAFFPLFDWCRYIRFLSSSCGVGSGWLCCGEFFMLIFFILYVLRIDARI